MLFSTYQDYAYGKHMYVHECEMRTMRAHDRADVLMCSAVCIPFMVLIIMVWAIMQ